MPGRQKSIFPHGWPYTRITKSVAVKYCADRHGNPLIAREKFFNWCAQSLITSRSALGAYCRRMCGRLGKPKGIVATAHKLAVLVYRMMKFGHEYTDIGQERFE